MEEYPIKITWQQVYGEDLYLYLFAKAENEEKAFKIGLERWSEYIDKKEMNNSNHSYMMKLIKIEILQGSVINPPN